jgi:spore coat protein U-like protein
MVQKSCSSSSGAQKDATATVSVTSTNTTPYQVGINAGLHSSANFDWEMIGPSSDLLSYKIYQNAGRTTYWGGTQGIDTMPGTGNGNLQAIPIYGRIAAGQNKIPGAYTDTATFTVYY